MIGRECYNIFDETYTYLHYDGETVDAVYFNPNGGQKGKGSFVENSFTIEYLLGLNLDDIMDLYEYVFNDDTREEFIYDFGHLAFANVLEDVFNPDHHWIAFGTGVEISAYLIGIIEANRRKK